MVHLETAKTKVDFIIDRYSGGFFLNRLFTNKIKYFITGSPDCVSGITLERSGQH